MDTPNWDMIQSAAAYSTLTGILAGFALTAVTVIVTVVTNRRHQLDAYKRTQLEMTAGWLITSFFSLLLVSFLFAVLSGHDRFVITVDSATHQLNYGAKTIQPLLLGLPVSLLFSSAALQLFLGIVWLFELVQLGRLAQLCARVMFWFLIPLSAVHIHSYYSTIVEERTQKDPPLSLQFWGVALGALAVPLTVFVLTRLPGWFRHASQALRNWRDNRAAENVSKGESEASYAGQAGKTASVFRYAPVLASLGLTLIIGISFGVLENEPESSFSDPHFDLTPVIWIVYSLLAVLWTLYVLGLPMHSVKSSVKKQNDSIGTPGDDTIGRQDMAHESVETQSAAGRSYGATNIDMTNNDHLLTAPIYAERRRNTFANINLTLISIIQGVALYALTYQTYSSLTASHEHAVLTLLPFCIDSFVFICIATFEYTWFIVVFQWAPTVFDIVIPLGLGFFEILQMYYFSSIVTWTISSALVCFAGAVAYSYSHFTLVSRKKVTIEESRREDARAALSKYFTVNISICVLTGFFLLATGLFVLRSDVLNLTYVPPNIPELFLPAVFFTIEVVILIRSTRLLAKLDGIFGKKEKI